MKTDTPEIPRDPVIKRRRIFNLLWWIGMMILGFVFILSPVSQIIYDAESSLFGSHWQVWFFGIVIPFFILQTVLHWYALNYLYSERRESNVIWVIFMPILLFIGDFVIFWIIFALGFNAD